MTKSTGLRLALFALAASTSLSGLAAQTAPAGRPLRTPPAPSATPTPTPSPAAQTTPAPIRLGTPKPAATPAPAPAQAKPAAAPAPVTTAKPAITLQNVDPKTFTSSKIPLNMIVPPAKTAMKPLAGAVMLTGRSYEDTIAKLPIARRLTGDQLRADPRITVGTTEIDFTPVLKDPLSIPTLAAKLRAMPNLVTLEAEQLDVAEVTGQGVAVKAIMTYRIKPGACDNPQNRAKLASVMARCFEERTEAQLDAAFADPKDPRYVADPAKRAEVVKLARQRRAQMMVQINQRIGEFRTRVKEPQLRKDLTAGVGEAEVNRLSALSDKALTRELINQSRVKIEDVMFIPRLDASDKAGAKTLKSGDPETKNPKAAAQAPDADVTVTQQLEPLKFLTGFTLGREYEWQKRIEATIPWCLVGCEETYFAEAYAGFGAGLGLRLPFEVSGTYTYKRVKGVETATFRPVFKTVNADTNFYSAVGLPANQHFQGQELLAKFGAWAGLRVDLPVVGYVPLGIPKENPLGVDFTADLPGDLKGGQFTPPMPCPPNSGQACPPGPSATKNFENFDLTGGIANIGIAGAKVFPFVRVNLVSDALTVKLVDVVDNNSVRTISAVAPPQDYALKISGSTKTSRFKLVEPNYALGMKLTPGITARLFVDLAVWGAHWDFEVPLPQLGLEVPKGGKTFSCHDQTICDRTIAISPSGVSVAGTVASPYSLIANWYETFDGGKSLSIHCPNAARPQCEADLKAFRDNTVNGLGGQLKANPKLDTNWTATQLKIADLQARGVVVKSHMKQRAQTVILPFKSQCLDDQCRKEIDSYVAAIQLGTGADLDPSNPIMAVVDIIETNYRTMAQKSVAQSKARAGK